MDQLRKYFLKIASRNLRVGNLGFKKNGKI